MLRRAALCLVACATSMSAETARSESPAASSVREQVRFLEGRVDSNVRARRLSFGRIGRITRIAVGVGDEVRRNQLLATIGCPELEAALAAAEAELEIERLSFARRKRGPNAVELELAEEQLALAEADLGIAQVAHERLKALFRQNGLIPKQELEAAARRAVAAGLEVAAKRHALHLLQEPIRPEDEMEQVAREKLRLARVAQARQQLAFCQILAPDDATVADVHLWPGEFAAAGVPVVSISDDSQRAVLVRLAEPVDMQEGGKVRLRLAAIPGRTFDGIVSSYRVGPVSESGTGVSCMQPDPDADHGYIWIETSAPLAEVPMFSAVQVRLVPRQ